MEYAIVGALILALMVIAGGGTYMYCTWINPEIRVKEQRPVISVPCGKGGCGGLGYIPAFDGISDGDVWRCGGCGRLIYFELWYDAVEMKVVHDSMDALAALANLNSKGKFFQLTETELEDESKAYTLAEKDAQVLDELFAFVRKEKEKLEFKHLREVQ